MYIARNSTGVWVVSTTSIHIWGRKSEGNTRIRVCLCVCVSFFSFTDIVKATHIDSSFSSKLCRWIPQKIVFILFQTSLFFFSWCTVRAILILHVLKSRTVWEILIIMHESDCTCYIVSLDNKQNGAKKNFSCHDLFIQNYLFVYFIFLSLMWFCRKEIFKFYDKSYYFSIFICLFDITVMQLWMASRNREMKCNSRFR